MSLASVSSPFRLPFGDHDRLRGHCRAVGPEGRHGVREPPGVVPHRMIPAHMGTAAFFSKLRGGHDDLADAQERFQLQERPKLIVVAPSLARDAALPVPRGQLPDLGRCLLEAGRVPQWPNAPTHHAPQLASHGSRTLRTRGPIHDNGDPAPFVLESRVYPLRGSRFLRSRQAGSLPEDEGFQEPVASETVGAVDAGVGAASTGVESRDARGAIGVDLDPTHRAVRHRAHRDRVRSRIDPGLRLDDVAGEGKPALELLAVELSQIEGDELGWPADDLFFGGPSYDVARRSLAEGW